MTESAELTKSESNIDKLPVKKRKIDINKAFQLRFVKGWTYSEIASYFNCKPQSVNGALKKFTAMMDAPSMMDTYANNRVKVLDAVEFKMIENLTDDKKIKDASLNNVAYAFNQVHNARRLESNQSTSNVSVDVQERLRRANSRDDKQ